jgi:hypothetical protein
MNKDNKGKESLEQKYPGLFGINMAYGTSGLNQTGTSDVSGQLTDNKGTKSVENKGSNLNVVGGESQRETIATFSAENRKV